MMIGGPRGRGSADRGAEEDGGWEPHPPAVPTFPDARERSTSSASGSDGGTRRSRARSQSETISPFTLATDVEGLSLAEASAMESRGISIHPPSTGTGGAGGGLVGAGTVGTARMLYNRRDMFLSGRHSPTSSEGDDSELQMYSTSYAGPREFSNYTFQMVQMAGYLEKQSIKRPDRWKRRWFVMQESVLFYYHSESDVLDKKPTDETCRGVIQLDSVDSVTTAKDFGIGAFQIRSRDRKFILRAESKELMHDWLFNFQKSIANIISVLLRSKLDHRSSRLSNSLTRRSFTRVSRSVSFDCQDHVDFSRMSADFPSHHLYHAFPETGDPFDESTHEVMRTSPRRASSPLNYSQYGPRSPIAMFAFDPPFESIGDDGHGYDYRPSATDEPLIEGKEEEEDEDDTSMPQANLESTDVSTGESPKLQKTMSPPVSTGKYIPRFLRDRMNAVATAPPPPEVVSPPRTSPMSTSRGWRMSFETKTTITKESDVVFFDDNVSFTTGGDGHGVTSLKGVRKSLEDVCCCIPNLNSHIDVSTYTRHAMYALFDGHCGVRAASFLNDKLLDYLCEHTEFLSNARQAFTECFQRIDREFLSRATTELLADGSTAAVVLIRGNMLLTANLGDSRAVVSINGMALDVIEEQTPGRPDERQRIENLGGWVKEERELQMSKLHSMDLSDPRIQQKAERVVRWVNIYRVNGELAVSRAIGDMDYKGAALTDYEFWAFPEGHDRKFHGDLVICEPEFKEIEITPEVQFLILACDGLWDTITSQEAVNHVSEKLAEGLPVTEVSHSLADLAIRSGSADNVSVIVVLLQT